METPDEEDRRWREQLRRSITVHRAEAALGEEVLSPILYRVGVLYGYRVAPLTILNNELEFTDTGRYFRLDPARIDNYDDCYVLKWGYTCGEVWKRGRKLISELKGKAFPENEINMPWRSGIRRRANIMPSNDEMMWNTLSLAMQGKTNLTALRDIRMPGSIILVADLKPA